MPINSGNSRKHRGKRFVANSTLFVNNETKGSDSIRVPTHCFKHNENKAICLLCSDTPIHVDDVVDIAIDNRRINAKIQAISYALPNHDIVELYRAHGTGDGNSPPRPHRPSIRILRIAFVNETELKNGE